MYIDRIQIDRYKLPRDAEDSYVFDLPALRGLQTLSLKKKVTFFVGENGTGKSTLLRQLQLHTASILRAAQRIFNFPLRKVIQNCTGLFGL
jgi:predicted ATPase